MNRSLSNIAVVVVAYNREKSLLRLLNSISNAFYDSEVTLIISIDKSKNPKVKEIADAFIWSFGNKIVVEHTSNLGLKAHILSCGKYLSDYDAIIILEDDLLVSRNFFQFAQQAVAKYSKDERIAGISLYSFSINYMNYYPFMPSLSYFDVYFIKCAQSWGQIWMKQQWEEFRLWLANASDYFDYTMLPKAICSWSSKSWLKYHTRYCIEKNKYFVYPYQSLTSNGSEIGVHAKFSTPVFETVLANKHPDYQFYLTDLTEESIRYDGFFESENIYNALSMTPEDLCIDLNRYKTTTNKRFLLTTHIKDYKIIKSFGLNMRPIEQNVIQNIEGKEIFLYDTNIKERNHTTINKRFQYAYYNNIDIFANIRRLISYGAFEFLKTLKQSL